MKTQVIVQGTLEYLKEKKDTDGILAIISTSEESAEGLVIPKSLGLDDASLGKDVRITIEVEKSL